MYRNNSLREKAKYEELYLQSKKLIKNNVLGLQQQSFSLRNSLAQERKDIVQKFRMVHYQHEPPELKIFHTLQDKVQRELMSIEEDCDEFIARMKLDLLAEARYRSEPPLRVPSVKVKEAFEVCRDALLENEEDIFAERCHCLWKNIPKSILEDTTIKFEKFDFPPSKFEKTDLKFKQDLTYLRTKLFSLANEQINSVCHTAGVERASSPRRKSYHEIVRKYRRQSASLGKDDLSQIHSLRFTDGEFVANELWARVLDVYSNQLRSKWYLVVCPQIEKMMKKRRIPSLHLDPFEVFNFLMTIPDGGIHCMLSKKDLFPLLKNFAIEGPWLTSWKPQLKTIDKENIAAVLIQAQWRGHWLRKQLKESHRRYIAASVLWYKWLSVKNKREMNAAHLRNMLMSLKVARELSVKFSKELDDVITQPHVVIHVPSLGFPLDIRRTFSPKMLAVYQHSTSLRVSFLRNPMSEIIYVLPIEPTQDFLSMYVDAIDSVVSQERTANRMTFLSLSQAKTLERTHMNVSRILHCSEDTLTAIRFKIKDKPAYILPWIVDECDVRISDNLSVPLLGPDMELQQELLNLSRMTEIIDGLGLPQPAHSKGIREYSKLCSNLAELIVLNTEICLWLIRLNFGIRAKHHGIFLINHISIPFMPVLREARKQHGDEWRSNPSLREEFLNALLKHLPKVIPLVTRLNGTYYDSWKDFYLHVQKFGCLLQAVPNEKKSSTIAVSLFVPNKITNKSVKWVGTSDKIQLDSKFSTLAYMIPQTSVNVTVLYPNVNKLAHALQQKGYFGYLTIDCYCYPDKEEEKTIVLLLDVYPYYCHVQHYIDWVKFVIDGSYNVSSSTFNANIEIPENNVKGISMLRKQSPEWNETTERAAIAICELYHVNLSSYSWSKLKTLMTDTGMSYDATKKEGCHFILHDPEMKNVGTMVAVTPCMKKTILTTFSNLRKLCHVLYAKKSITAQLVTHPTDVVKLQMQITNNSFVETIKDIFATRGTRSFYDGLSAALLRQVTYTMAKLGFYTSLLEYWTDNFGRPNYCGMISLGMFSGVIAAIVGTPADVILVRMVGDAKLPPEQRRNYRNVITAIMTISKNEGVKTLWRGVVPTMGRAAIVNGAQLGTYSRTKYALIDTDNALTQFLAANVSGCATCVTSLPLDLAKTKIQNWAGISKPPSMITIIIQTTRQTGFLSLWRGFLAFYAKTGPTTIISMLCVDQLRDLYLHLAT
ncbi:hypothetical protein KPH14_004632 [Odynerus spinipes]|uniref:IQCH-like ATP-grasp domain-containing protein n=1 Tax=Odynerus spinipes TaxID=1348599 RepID=A0AAD9VQG1_9HYME|nr:hypothetical protein KPH14_004632 [Odynerus spinipes]